MSKVYDQREDLHAAKKREERNVDAEVRRRIRENGIDLAERNRIMQEALRKEDPVLVILKQAQQLSYRDFKRLSNILGVNANEADQAVEDGVMMIEEEQDK